MTVSDSRPAPPSEDAVAHLRTPPHSVEAEQSIIGGLLLDNEAFDRVGDLLVEADFYRHEHRLIFSSMAQMIAASKQADVITVFEHMQSIGDAERAGGLVYLNALAQSVPSAANIRRYSEIVRERSVMRSLISASDEIATAAFNPQGRAAIDIINSAQDKILRLGEAGAARGGSTFISLDRVVLQLLDNVQLAADQGGRDVTGLPTGFIDLDTKLSGLQDGLLYVVGGRPSMGKTAFAFNIAQNIAVQQKMPVVVFSLEMGASQLGLRMVGSLGRIEMTKLRSGKLQDSEWARLSDTVERLSGAVIDIDESSALNIADLRARARRKKREHGKLGLIVIDYMQLMGGQEGSDENRATVVGDISRGLKGLAKELQCPVIALSQLNRGLEQRSDKRPVMSDLRESGAVEQDADVIMFIYRDDYYNKASRERGVAEIIIGKHRDGPTGTVKLAFQKETTTFTNLALDYEPEPVTKSRQAEY